MRRPGMRATIATGILVLAMLAPGLEPLARAQPCITCRTEKCPTKGGLSDWCGQGKDPLAKKAPPGNETRTPTVREYKIELETQPSGARAVVNGTSVEKHCDTPCTLNLPRGRYHIVIAAPGYVTLERDFNVTRSLGYSYALEKQPIVIEKTIEKPPPNIARLEVRSAADQSARGGSVFLDGKAVGVVPAVVDVEPGKHRFDVTRPGYTDHFETLDLAAGEKRIVEVALRPRTGNLLVIANVPDATVTVDGTKRDVAPASILGLSEGKHVIEVTRPGFSTWRTDIDIAAGSETKLHADIAPLPKELTPEEKAAIAAKQHHDYVMLVLEQTLLHPVSFTFQPVMLTEFHPNTAAYDPKNLRADYSPGNKSQNICYQYRHSLAFADCAGGVTDQTGAQLSARFTWLEGDIGLVGWANPTSKWIVRYSIGVSPVTLGTWMGKKDAIGVTLFEPFFLYRWYNASGALAHSVAPGATASTTPGVSSLVVGNRFFAELGPVGIGVEISGEIGLDSSIDGFDWAFNAGIVLRAGNR